MPLFGQAELTQRERMYLVVHPRGLMPAAEEISISLRLEDLRKTSARTKLLILLEQDEQAGISAMVRAEHVLRLTRESLATRGVVLFTEFQAVLAFFNEAARRELWERLFKEVLDVPGFGLLLLENDSQLQPGPEILEKYPAQVRCYRAGPSSEAERQVRKV